MHKIAIYGIMGSYHHIAAIKFFGEECHLMECSSFEEVVKSVFSLNPKKGVMAIENSLAGSIFTNYVMLSKYKLKILGEVFIPINQCLMTLSGQSLKDVKELISHSMALLQCKKYFNQYTNIKVLECTDTSEGVRYIAKNKMKNLAAIATEIASTIYGLNILEKNIQDHSNNFTRFFIVSSSTSKDKNFSDRASIKFRIDYKIVPISRVLRIFSKNWNITSIQSITIFEKTWENIFFLDLSFEEYGLFQKMMDLLSKETFDILRFGEYKNGWKII